MVDKRALSIFCCALIVTVVHADGLSLHDLLANEPQTDSTAATPDPPQFWYDRTADLPPLDMHALLNDPRFDARVSQRIALNALDFAHDIGRNLLADSRKSAEIFSPLSIYSALSLLLLGSSGRTFDELMRVMHFDTDTYLKGNPWKIHEDFGLLLEDVARIGQTSTRRREPTAWKVHRGPATPSTPALGTYRDETLSDYRVSVANGLFVQKGYSLRADYRSAVLGIYQSNLKNLDFTEDSKAATEYINTWVNRKTEGKIPKIISDQLSPDTKIVMASALYFNARWEKTFIEGGTGPKNFYPDGLNEPPITVEMMGNGGRFPFYDSMEYDCRIIGLPYKHNMTTMYIIQPNNSDRKKLRELQSLLTADKIESMIAKMQWETSIILLPKMHITNEINLKEVLSGMGVRTLFSLHDSDLALISNGLGADTEIITGQTFVPPPVLSGGVAAAAAFPPRAALDDSTDAPFIFSPSDDHDTAKSRARRNVITYKVPSQQKSGSVAEPLSMKSFLLGKRITKTSAGKKLQRHRRQIDLSESIKRLDQLRLRLRMPDTTRNDAEQPNGLFVDEILHQVDLTVNEKGTEGGAATVTTLFRTGTDVVMRVETPFMFLIRHDETKLPLFYGAVFEPSSGAH